MTPPRYPNEDTPTGCRYVAMIVAGWLGAIAVTAWLLRSAGVL